MLAQFVDDNMGDSPSWVGRVLLFAFGSKNTDEESLVSYCNTAAQVPILLSQLISDILHSFMFQSLMTVDNKDTGDSTIG